MMKIEYSPASLEDLKNINNYINQNCNPDKAKEVLSKLTDSIRNLANYPMLGSSLANIIDNAGEYRYIFSEKNYIFCRVDFNRILIVRILNEKQNYMSILFKIGREEDSY